MAGWFGAEHVREHRQPFAKRSGVIVDDVVDARSVVFERKDGGCGSVVEVDERGDAFAIADDGESPLPYGSSRGLSALP